VLYPIHVRISDIPLHITCEEGWISVTCGLVTFLTMEQVSLSQLNLNYKLKNNTVMGRSYSAYLSNG